jgi:hypothetical protein
MKVWGNTVSAATDEKVPYKGTFISNEGNEWKNQIPFKVSKNIYVFGGYDGGWFKMKSVDANGIQKENRYTKSVNSIEDLTIEIWNSANKGGDYKAEDIIFVPTYTSSAPTPTAPSAGAGEDGEAGEDGKSGKDGKDGKAGEAGEAGEDGKDGKDGEKGSIGKAGTDGTGLRQRKFNIGDNYVKGDYVFEKSSTGSGNSMWIAQGFKNIYEGFFLKEPFTAKSEPKSSMNWVEFRAPAGPPGDDGAKGEIGKQGKDGKNGMVGDDGSDGEDGADGNDGKDGVDGINGKDGADGISVKDDGSNGRVTWVPPPPPSKPKYRLKMEYEETEYKLPNNYLVRPGKGICPNDCKVPHYDNKDCSDEILDGKAYRKCPWVKDGMNNLGCDQCGSILMPKNQHGYARTRPGLFDNISVEMAIKNSKKTNKGDYYNIGKNFMKQLSDIKHFELPNNISTDEFVAVGKLVHKHQTENSDSSNHLITRFINGILTTGSISRNNKINNNSRISSQTNSLGGIFDIDNTKLTGKGSYAFAEAEQELASNNRLGGSSDMYEKQISEKVRIQNGIPRDPKKRPNPYNSIWNMFGN